MLGINNISRSQGTTRNLTSQYKDFRRFNKENSYKLPSHKYTEDYVGQNLLITSDVSIDYTRDSVPPEWVDNYDNILEDLDTLNQHRKIYTVLRMESLQKQRISITFGDTRDKDVEIYELSQQITEVYYS